MAFFRGTRIRELGLTDKGLFKALELNGFTKIASRDKRIRSYYYVRQDFQVHFNYDEKQLIFKLGELYNFHTFAVYNYSTGQFFASDSHIVNNFMHLLHSEMSHRKLGSQR